MNVGRERHFMSKKSCAAAESAESAVKPSVEGFANGAGERPSPRKELICIILLIMKAEYTAL